LKKTTGCVTPQKTNHSISFFAFFVGKARLFLAMHQMSIPRNGYIACGSFVLKIGKTAPQVWVLRVLI
jgi:hypothetical protein